MNERFIAIGALSYNHLNLFQENFMKMEARALAILIILILNSIFLSACSFNPFRLNNNTTGSAAGAVVGAGVGAGTVALFSNSKPLMALAGLGGGMFGYYVTTLRYDAGGVIYGGGEVYHVGNYVSIVIPTDCLFEVNSADFLPSAPPILDSAAAVLGRNPNNNIIISGNTSGFARARWERKLSEKRAQRVSAYLWNAGISKFKGRSNNMRKLTYVGYGNYFPIANHYTNDGIRANSRIQITSYPDACELMIDRRSQALNNVGRASDRSLNDAPACNHSGSDESNCFSAGDPYRGAG